MNQGYHNTFIITIVVIIVIFTLLLLGGFCISKESFTNPGLKPLSKNPGLNAKKTNNKFIDTLVPENLGYSDITGYYNGLEDGLKGTSLVNVSSIDSARYPIMIETPTNWYNTQSLILEQANLGTNEGKLPNSDCFCRDRRLLFNN